MLTYNQNYYDKKSDKYTEKKNDLTINIISKNIDNKIKNIILSKLRCFYNLTSIHNVIKLLLNDIAYKKTEIKKNDKKTILKNELNNFLLKINEYPDTFYFNEINKISDYTELDNYIYHLETGAFGSVFRVDSSLCIKCIYFPIDNQRHEYLIPLEISNYLIKNRLNSYICFFNIPYMLLENFNLNVIDKYFKLHSFILVILRMLIDSQFDVTDLGNVVYKFSEIEKNYKYLFKDMTSDKINQNYKFVTYLYNKHTNNTENLVLFNKFDSFIEMYKQIFIKTEKEKIVTKKKLIGSALIMPLAISTSVDLKLNNDYIPDMINGTYAYKIDKDYYRYLIIQTLLPILIMNKDKFIFSHNDLKPNNILVFHCVNPIIIPYKNKYFNFNKKYIFKITDFDFSNFINVPNKKIINKSYLNLNNIIYDVYYLFYNMVEIFFKKTLQYDKELYSFLTSFINKYKHEKNNSAIYMGNKRLDVLELEKLLFESTLFDKWIVKN